MKRDLFNLLRKTGFFFVGIMLLFSASVFLQAAPSITGITAGRIEHGQPITILGSGFGAKSQAPPWRSSFMYPTAAQNYQASGSFDSLYWVPRASIMLALQDSVTRVKKSTHAYYARLEYSARGNGAGYSAGIDIDLPQTPYCYVAFWEYFQPGFNCSYMHTGSADFKWLYYGLNSPAGYSARALCSWALGTQFEAEAFGGVAGVNASTPDAHLYDNLLLPFGGSWYARGSEWVANYPVSVGRWYLVEIMDKYNSAPGVQDGWNEMRIDNQTIYRATNMAQAMTSDTKPYFYDLRFGGNYGWVGGLQVQYRYYGDMYVDGTLQRVALGDSSAYGKCKHIELQIPQTWSGTGISIVFNQGSFSNAQTAYLFVIDSSNNASPGYPLTIGGTTGISVPSDKSTNGTIYFKITEQNGNFRIGADEAIRRIDITDIMGKIIYSSNPGANNFVWLQQDNTARMVSRGIYFVRLIGSKSVQCKRVVLPR